MNLLTTNSQNMCRSHGIKMVAATKKKKKIISIVILKKFSVNSISKDIKWMPLHKTEKRKISASSNNKNTMLNNHVNYK